MSVPFVRAPIGPGIYRVHKPVGHTSFSLVQAFMDEVQAAGIRRDRLPVCHGGALDPFAEGLVLLLAGQATRLMDLLHPVPKTYLAEIAWGAETDNGDPLGRIVSRADPSRLSADALEQALTPFLGWREQVPPTTSNKRVDGERAYRKAHRGESFELPPSRVYLHEARFISHRLPASSKLLLVTGGGYYVRSLVRDLGRATGALAHLAALRRTAIGPWEDPPPGQRVWLRGAELFPWCASLPISAPELSALQGGKSLPSRPLAAPEWSLPSGFPDPQAPIRGLFDGDLVALLRHRDGELWPERLLGAPRRARRPARRRR
jgi:tRNA pseudouridine55 synthase